MANAGPVGAARRLHRFPGRYVGQWLGVRQLGWFAGRIRHHRERAIEGGTQGGQRQHRIDHAMSLQVLRGLHPGRERFTVEVLVDPGAEEADQRAGLGRGDVPEGTPGGEHPTGGGVSQVDEVGQVGLFVQFDGGGDLDHLQKGDGALLHAGTPGARRRQQR